MAQNRMEELLAKEIAAGQEMRWWLSFAGDGGFRGVIVTKAYGFTHAIKRTHELKINPSGYVEGFCLPESADFPEDKLDQLLSATDLNQLGFVKA